MEQLDEHAATTVELEKEDYQRVQQLAQARGTSEKEIIHEALSTWEKTKNGEQQKVVWGKIGKKRPLPQGKLLHLQGKGPTLSEIIVNDRKQRQKALDI